jgi:ABC-type nitrate/sulfonate/bicarbonate transport system substrate-binding protein
MGSCWGLMKSQLRLFLVGIALPLAFAWIAYGQASEPQVVRVVCLPARPLALAAAEANGIFARYGISVQAEVATSSDLLRGGLASGKYMVAHAAVDNEVAMYEGGDTDVAIVMGGEGSTNELIAQSGVQAIADLRGKVLIVDAPHTAYALQLKKILLSNGMQLGRDYELKPVGSTPVRLQAMRDNKEYAASMLGVPTSILARTDGFVSLGNTQNLIGPYQGIGAFVKRSWAKDNSALLTKYIAASVEAQRWLMAPGNKQQAIALMEKEWKLSPEVAAQTYAAEVEGPGGLEKDARFDLDGFKNVLKIRADVEGQWQGTPPSPERYFDLTYYDAAVGSIQPGK